MKLATRSVRLHNDDDGATLIIARSIIECYQTAQRSMPMPVLRQIEKRTDGHDVQFVLTFEPARITTRTGDGCVVVEVT